MKDFLARNKTALLVAVVAVIVRWIYVIQLSGNPGFSVPMVDEKWHWQWALDILNGPFLGQGAWFRAPLYPYFLAFLAFVTGHSILWTKLLQVVVCGGTAFFLFKLTEQLINRRAALIAGLIYAFYGTLLYYEAMFLIPVLFLFFVIWGMYRLIVFRDSPRIATWLLTGLVFGLAAISRPNILLVMPALAIWIWLAVDRGRPLLPRLRRPVLLATGVLIAIAPVTIRNLAVTGDFILISSQGGVNFYIGNNPVANGLSMRMPEVELSEDLSWRQFQPATDAAARRLAGKDLTQAEISSFWTDRAVDWMTDNPGDFAALVWRRFVYLLSGFENSDNSDIYYERGKSGLYALLLWDKVLAFPFGVLLPLALAGVYLRRRDFGKLLPVYLFMIVYTPTIILFLVTARHRLPLVPFLILLAAAGIVSLTELFSKKNVREVGIAGIIIILSLLLFNRTYYEEGGRNDFQIHFNAGIKAERTGDYAAAEKEYALADEYFPYSPSLLTNLGYARYVQGKVSAAEKDYRRALQIDPNFHRALNNLGLVVAQRGQLDSAKTLYLRALNSFDSLASGSNEMAQVYVNLADIYERQSLPDSAAAAFDSAMVSAPTWGEGFYRASAFFARRGSFARSDSLFSRAIHHASPNAIQCFNHGLSLIQRDYYEEALKWLFDAVKRDRQFSQAYYLIGAAMYRLGQPSDSVVKYLDQALQYNPGYQQAMELKKQVTGP